MIGDASRPKLSISEYAVMFDHCTVLWPRITIQRMRTPRLPNTYRDISLPQWCALWKATRFEFTINLRTSRGRLRTRGNRETSRCGWLVEGTHGMHRGLACDNEGYALGSSEAVYSAVYRVQAPAPHAQGPFILSIV